MALKILRSFYDELCQIAEDNTPAVDIRFGAVIYTRDDSSWSLSTAWMDTTEMEFVFDQDASPSSHASYDLNIAMQKAIEMDWREDAAPVVVFFPLIAASPDVRVNTKDAELCRRVKAQHMVLVSFPSTASLFATDLSRYSILIQKVLNTTWYVFYRS